MNCLNGNCLARYQGVDNDLAFELQCALGVDVSSGVNRHVRWCDAVATYAKGIPNMLRQNAVAYSIGDSCVLHCDETGGDRQAANQMMDTS